MLSTYARVVYPFLMLAENIQFVDCFCTLCVHVGYHEGKETNFFKFLSNSPLILDIEKSKD